MIRFDDMPDWVQKLYWHWHGPIGHPQPRGATYMSSSGAIGFLITEGVLAICILLAFFGIDWLVTSPVPNKLLKALVALVLGGLMLLKLLAFAGVA